MKKEYKKLLTNTGLLAIGSFASSLLGMLLIPFYTAVLSTSDYGISDLIATTTSLLYPFATLAISESIMRFALDKDNDKKSIYSIGITLVLCGYLLIICFLPLIKKTTIGNFTTYFLLYYLLYCLHTITSYFVKGLEQVKVYSIAGIVNTFIVIICNLIFLLVFNAGIKGYIISSIIGHAVTTIYMVLKAKLYKYLIPFWKINIPLLKNMLMYSIPIIPNSISWWIANSSDKYVLNHFSDVSQVGIYAVSYKIPTIMMTVMGFFISAWQLSSVEDFGSEKSRHFFSDIYNKCFKINIILASMLILSSKFLGKMLFSADFFVAWKYSIVLIIANVFNVLASFLGTIYTASKQTKMLFYSTGIGSLTNIVLNFILIPDLGALGAAIATAISYMSMWIIRIINSRKIMRFDINWISDILMLILLITELITTSFDTIISHAISLIIFLIILYFNKKIFIDMLKALISVLKKHTNTIH